jgi:hypothetical protein
MTSRRAKLISDIEAFCRRHEMATSTFGRLAVNDGKFFDRLKDGKNIGFNTADKVDEFMAAETAKASGAAA